MGNFSSEIRQIVTNTYWSPLRSSTATAYPKYAPIWKEQIKVIYHGQLDMLMQYLSLIRNIVPCVETSPLLIGSIFGLLVSASFSQIFFFLGGGVVSSLYQQVDYTLHNCLLKHDELFLPAAKVNQFGVCIKTIYQGKKWQHIQKTILICLINENF